MRIAWAFVMLPIFVTAQDTVPLQLVGQLPVILQETSGLAFIDGTLWTFNDGGGNPEIYQLDTLTGNIVRSVEVNGAINVDWEDIASNDSHIFIGDFGNNFGSRNDLRIYKVDRDSVLDVMVNSVTAEVIEFSYADQTQFTPALDSNNYDCEAMICVGDSIHLYSKRWLDEWTTQYILPIVPGMHVAQVVDSLDVDGLVTGADISDDGLVVLCGYRENVLLEPFLWTLTDFNQPSLLNGINKRWVIDDPLLQVEGVSISYDRKVFLSSEGILNLVQPSLWYTNIPMSTETWDIGHTNDGVLVDSKGFVILMDGGGPFSYQLFDASGRLVESGSTSAFNRTSYHSPLQNGVHLLGVWGAGGTSRWVTRFVVQ